MYKFNFSFPGGVAELEWHCMQFVCIPLYNRGLLCFTANEGPVRIQYKCLVSIYVFPEMNHCSLLISKTEL
jgi:hypothetical protein